MIKKNTQQKHKKRKMNFQGIRWKISTALVRVEGRSTRIHHLHSRCFSSGGGPSSRERRRRFYVEVGVSPCSAPWHADNDSSSKKVPTVISAGVDGTDSASGVNRSLESNKTKLMKYLQPRIPGTVFDETTCDNDSVQWYSILLDGRSLRSPLGRRLAVPSIHLAHGIASEWNAIGMYGTDKESATSLGASNYIVPSQMPFMTLACTALDQTSSQIQFYQEQCLRYLHTDTICYWADPVEDRSLHGRQQNAWKDIHEWIETDFAPDNAAVAIGLMEGVMLARGRKGVGHSPALITFCENWITSLDAWHLTAFHSICADTKSFLVAAALLMKNYSYSSENGTVRLSNFRMDVDRALAAGRVEEEFNIENWGLVEGGHDYDRLNMAVQVNSASLLTDYISIVLKTHT